MSPGQCSAFTRHADIHRGIAYVTIRGAHAIDQTRARKVHCLMTSEAPERSRQRRLGHPIASSLQYKNSFSYPRGTRECSE